MTRLYRTRKDSVIALLNALKYVRQKVRSERQDFRSMKLCEVSKMFRISSLPFVLLRPYVLADEEPTFDTAKRFREELSAYGRAKGGTRAVSASKEPEVAQRPLQKTLFNFNTYDAIEEANKVCDALRNAGLQGYTLDVKITEDSYTLNIAITKPMNQ